MLARIHGLPHDLLRSTFSYSTHLSWLVAVCFKSGKVSLRFSRESHVEYGQEGLCVCVKPSLQSSDRDRGGPDASRARGRCSECVCCPHVVHRWLSQCLSLVASSSADLPAVARCPARNPRVWSSLRRLHTLHKAPFVFQLHFYFS